MRKSAGKMFAVQFLKSFLFIVFFIGIILMSYRAVMHYYGEEKPRVIESVSPAKKETSLFSASIDDISKHLIFCVDEKNGDIKKLVLEIFNCETNRIVYITIPIKTQFTLSDSLYRELVLIKPSIPQFLKLSAITGYLPEEWVYEYGVLMIEDLLDIQLSYYSVVPQKVYDTVFETEILPLKSDNKSNYELVTGEMFSDGFLELLHTIETETDLRKYIEGIYTKMDSNLSIEGKLYYVESYLGVKGENISFELIAGEESNSAYTVDKVMASKQIEAYIDE